MASCSPRPSAGRCPAAACTTPCISDGQSTAAKTSIAVCTALLCCRCKSSYAQSSLPAMHLSFRWSVCFRCKKRLGLLDLKLQGFPFHVQHMTFFLKNCTFEPKKLDGITERQINRKSIESRWHMCSSEDTKQCTSWQDSSRIKNRDSKMHSKT